MDDFFIGYEPPLPPSLARFTRRASIVAIAGAAGIAVMLATSGHRRLDGGRFAYGSPETVTGRVIAHPHPAVLEDGRGSGAMTLLVARGKHGAASLAASLDGRLVSLQGTRISRQERDMLELVPGTLALRAPEPRRGAVDRPERRAGAQTSVDTPQDPPRRVQLRGEVVDTKCHLGVMVPGEGHTHAACASLCLRGGIPAALLVRDTGQTRLYLLESPSGEALGSSVAAWAGRPMLVAGVTGQRGGWWTLRTTPATWRAAP
jgi:hypothetical protein